MRFFKTILCMSIAAMLAFSATACNNIGENSGGVETGKTIKTESGIEIPVIDLGNNTDISIVSTGNYRYDTDDGLISKFFKKYYNGNILLKTVSVNELATVMATSVSAGTPSHLIELDAGFPSFAIRKLVAPVDDVGMTYEEKDFSGLRSSYDAYVYDEKHYVLPWASSTTQRIFYNVKIFEDNDMDTPMKLYEEGKWTYDALYDATKALYLDENYDGKPDRYGLAVAGYHAGTLAYGGGEPLIKIEGTKLINNISSNAFATGLNLLKKMIVTDKIVSSNFGEDYVTDLFDSGKTAMCLGPFFWAETQGLFNNMKMARTLEWVPLPKISNESEHYVPGGCGGFYMPQGVKESDYPLIKAFMYSCCAELQEEGMEGTEIYNDRMGEWFASNADYGYTEDDFAKFNKMNKLKPLTVMEPLRSIVFVDSLFMKMVIEDMSFEQTVANLSPGIDAELEYLIEDAIDEIVSFEDNTSE